MANILVIDDEVSIRELLFAILTPAGHRIFLAEHGAAGLALCGQHPMDLIITDIVMPDTDGLEVIARIKEHTPGAKIIAMSGGGMVSPHDYLQLAESMGAEATLPKPFSRADLTAAVNALLGPTP